ncbi:hypothetical protein CEXT_701651 [Caerostris extrusa]|uniref:Uncharacterized protein n=1 Tax=Caerostris extrusa TaxID=172846 RepID=A0AAV4WYF7_CAEEX|nr:hypothetical protein CEXT_701651 [Caerostris extrusa]
MLSSALSTVYPLLIRISISSSSVTVELVSLLCSRPPPSPSLAGRREASSRLGTAIHCYRPLFLSSPRSTMPYRRHVLIRIRLGREKEEKKKKKRNTSAVIGFHFGMSFFCLSKEFLRA